MESRNLIVEGLAYPNPNAPYQADGEHPPFVIFDVDRQEYLKGIFPTRALAEEALTSPMVDLPDVSFANVVFNGMRH